MEVEYERWNGVGDVLDVIDNRDGRYDSFFADQKQKRHLVVETQANGLMEIQSPPKDSSYCFKLVFHDGLGECGPIPLCGNGSRCTVAYACKYGIVPPEKMSYFEFLAGDGRHWASVVKDDVHTGKYDSTISMADIKEVKCVEGNNDEWYASSGTAHFVKYVEKGTLDSLDIMKEGARLATEKNYLGEGLLVIINFVEEREDVIHARCYDTGLGGVEILACGTASMVIAVVHATRNGEPDGEWRRPIQWKNDAVNVGYTKRGNAFHDNSLRSLVFMEVKGTFSPSHGA